jgi:hypothetical protein
MRILARSKAVVDKHPDDPNDLIAMLPARSFDLPTRRSKEDVQADQIASFANALAAARGLDHTDVTAAPRSDQNDHDYDLTVGSATYPVELTALLSDALREERRSIYRLGDLVREEIEADLPLASALAARGVLLRDDARQPVPVRAQAQRTAAAIKQVLHVGALPPPDGNRAVFLDRIDGVGVLLLPPGRANTLVTVATSVTTTTLSSARAQVRARLIEKDLKSREFVVLIAGDFSNDDLDLPVEVAEYELLAHAGPGSMGSLKHTKEAWLHLARTSELLRLI